MNASVAGQSKRRGENCTGKYSRGLRNQNGQHLVNLRKLNIFEKQVIFPIYIVIKPAELYQLLKVQIACKLR